MTNLKTISIGILTVLSLSSCGQSNTEKQQQSKNTETMYNINNYIFPETKDITEANFVEKLSSQIKHYDEEPIYYYRINKQNCLIEIDINDVNDHDDFELSNTITPIEIGNILKSGLQMVTVKMYPVGDLINQDLGLENEPPATTLSDKAKVDIQIVRIDKKSKGQFADERVITTQVSPKEAIGKEYYEFTFTFQADVPYELEGWTKGQDLRKLDPDLVRKKAIEFYEMVGQIHVNKDLNARLKLVYLSTIRIRQSFYKKDNVDDLLEEYREYVIDDYVVLPIENFRVDFMGNGKLLRLTTKSLEKGLRGYGALMLQYGEEGDIYQPGITLYLPEGRDLATQGFMMWK